MKILCLVDCYLPSMKSSAKLMADMAAEFRAQGHDVIVAAPDDSLTEPCRQSVENGVTVLRIRTGKIKGASKVVRAINEVRLSSVMWKAARGFFANHPCDLVVFYSPSIFFGGLVRRLKKLFRCPAYMILRDIFPQWAVDAGVLRKGLIYKYFRRKELLQYSVADVIGVQSPGNLAYFRDNGLNDRPLEVLFNWTPLKENAAPPGLRKRLGLNGKIVFFYGGNIGVAQDMDNIIRLAESLADRDDVHFLLVGEGSEVSRLNAVIAAKKLANISIHPAVCQEDYLGLVGEFDVGLISLDRDLKTHNFPGKMLGYMYHGLPILASINAGNDLKDVIEEGDAGLVCLNSQDEELRKNAIRFASDNEFRRQTGRNARALLEKTFSVRQAAEQILSHFAPANEIQERH